MERRVEWPRGGLAYDDDGGPDALVYAAARRYALFTAPLEARYAITAELAAIAAEKGFPDAGETLAKFWELFPGLMGTPALFCDAVARLRFPDGGPEAEKTLGEWLASLERAYEHGPSAERGYTGATTGGKIVRATVLSDGTSFTVFFNPDGRPTTHRLWMSFDGDGFFTEVESRQEAWGFPIRDPDATLAAASEIRAEFGGATGAMDQAALAVADALQKIGMERQADIISAVTKPGTPAKRRRGP